MRKRPCIISFKTWVRRPLTVWATLVCCYVHYIYLRCLEVLQSCLLFDHCLLNNSQSKKPINSKAYIVGQWKPHFSLQHHINAYGVSIYVARPHLINPLPHLACLSLCLFPSSLIFLPLLPCTIDTTVSFSHYSLHTHPFIHMNFPMGPACDVRQQLSLIRRPELKSFCKEMSLNFYFFSPDSFVSKFSEWSINLVQNAYELSWCSVHIPSYLGKIRACVTHDMGASFVRLTPSN